MERLRATFLFIKNSVFTPPQAEAVSKSSPFHKTGDQFFAQANAHLGGILLRTTGRTLAKWSRQNAGGDGASVPVEFCPGGLINDAIVPIAGNPSVSPSFDSDK